MRTNRVVVLGLVAVLAMGLMGSARAQEGVTISIEDFAQPTADGGVLIRVHVACEALPGTQDFIEALAGAGQTRTGAGGEGGLDGTVICDGVERVHTASFTPHEGVFKRGQARANVTIFYCNTVGDDQVCRHGSTREKIIIRGPVV